MLPCGKESSANTSTAVASVLTTPLQVVPVSSEASVTVTDAGRTQQSGVLDHGLLPAAHSRPPPSAAVFHAHMPSSRRKSPD